MPCAAMAHSPKWVLLATAGLVDDRTGDGDASHLGVVGTDRGVWLREVVDGRDT